MDVAISSKNVTSEFCNNCAVVFRCTPMSYVHFTNEGALVTRGLKKCDILEKCGSNDVPIFGVAGYFSQIRPEISK